MADDEGLEKANAFAETACKLLNEYSVRVSKQRQEAVTMLDKIYDERGRFDDRYLRNRYKTLIHEFYVSQQAFDVLRRKVSQWVEHGRSPDPHLELELQVRLADFEGTLSSMNIFLESNKV